MHQNQIAALINESPMNLGVDGAEWLRGEGNSAYGDDCGNVILFERVAPGVYEFHWLRTVTKGPLAVVFTHNAIDYMFSFSNTCLLFGMVPSDRRDSRVMARAIGAEHVGQIATEDGDAEMYIMTRAIRGRAEG